MGLWPDISTSPGKAMRLASKPRKLLGTRLGYTQLWGSVMLEGKRRSEFGGLLPNALRLAVARERLYRASWMDYILSHLQEYRFAIAKDQWDFQIPHLLPLDSGQIRTSFGKPGFSLCRSLNGAVELVLKDLWQGSGFVEDIIDGVAHTWINNGEYTHDAIPTPEAGLLFGITFPAFGGAGSHPPTDTKNIAPKYMRIASLRLGLGQGFGNPYEFSGTKYGRPIKWRLTLSGVTWSETIHPKQEWLTKTDDMAHPSRRSLDVLGFIGPIQQPSHLGNHEVARLIGGTEAVFGPCLLGTLIYWTGFIGTTRRYAAAFVGSASPEHQSNLVNTISSGISISDDDPVELHDVSVGDNDIPVHTGVHAPSSGFGTKVRIRIREPFANFGPPQESGFCGVALQFSRPLIDAYQQVPQIDVTDHLRWNYEKWNSLNGWGPVCYPQKEFIAPNAMAGLYEESVLWQSRRFNRKVSVDCDVNVALAGMRNVGMKYPKYLRHTTSGSYDFVVTYFSGTNDSNVYRRFDRAINLSPDSNPPWPIESFVAAHNASGAALPSGGHFVWAQGGILYNQKATGLGRSASAFFDRIDPDPIGDSFGRFKPQPNRLASQLCVLRVVDTDKLLYMPRAVPLIENTAPWSISGTMTNPTSALHKIKIIQADDAPSRTSPDPMTLVQIMFDDAQAATLDRLDSTGTPAGPLPLRHTQRGDSVSTVAGADYGSATYFRQTQRAIEAMITAGEFGSHLDSLSKYMDSKYTAAQPLISSLQSNPAATVPFATTSPGQTVKRNSLLSWETDELETPLVQRMHNIGASEFPDQPWRRNYAYDMQFDELVPPSVPIIYVRGYEFSMMPYVPVRVKMTSNVVEASYVASSSSPTVSAKLLIDGLPQLGAERVWMPRLYGANSISKSNRDADNYIRVISPIDLGSSITVRCIIIRVDTTGDPFNPANSVAECDMFLESLPPPGAFIQTTRAAAPAIKFDMTISRRIATFSLPRQLKTSLPMHWMYELISPELMFDVQIDQKPYPNVIVISLTPFGAFSSDLLRAGGSFEFVQGYFGASLPGICSIDGVDPSWS